MGTGPAIAILVLTLVHFAAFGLLFWHLAGHEMLSMFRLRSDDDDGGGPRREDPVPGDPRGPRDGGLPLPDADPAGVRLRGSGRLAEGYERRPRRPEHVPGEPGRAPVA